MRSKTYGFLYFAATIAAVIITLLMLNWLPLVLQNDTFRRYGTFEEARTRLNLKEIRVPSYFPETISWPPADVLAQAKPFPAVLMVFNRSGSREPALVISQARSDAFPENVYITPVQVKEKVPYQLKDRRAVLEVGSCAKEEPCSRLTWNEGASRITVTMKSPPFELIRIAESMVN